MTLDLVKKVGIGKDITLSDHGPIYLHISLSKVQKGKGFWRLNGDFLNEPEYVFSVNNVIERVIEQYSEQTNIWGPANSPGQKPASSPSLISHILLHDVLLIEIRSYTLEYAVSQKENFLKKTKGLNDLIDEKANSMEEEDIAIVEALKQEV